MGRSIDTGPAVTFARKFKLGGCMLLSPYTDIKSVAASITGSPFLGNLVSAHFNNMEHMKHLKCPLLIIHG